jgi:hypothetical protein
MQESVRGYAAEARRSTGVPIQIRVGLNSGEVVVRSISSDLHMDYSAIGQTTHLAARMEQMATPGAILLTPATLQLVEGYVQVRPLGPMPIRGLDGPMDVYEVLAAGAARTRLQAAATRGLTRFVGRDAEMDLLRGALDRAGAGRGQMVAAVGEPGVGKSRLVYELVHSHRSHGWLVLEAGSVSYGKATPYLPATDLLKAYFRIEPQDDERRIREKVAGKVLTLDEALRPYLPAYHTLLTVQVDDPSWGNLEPPQRKQQTLAAVKHLLLRESQVQPLLLVFEDLHWIDPETQSLLDSLVESVPSARVLLLVNYRPEYQHSWNSKTYYGQVRLDALGPESAEELLSALLGTDPGLADLKGLLIRRTEGNPFFLEESVRTLVETGALTGERGAYRATRPGDLAQVPATVQAMLAARIDRLPPEEKRLLQSAAVIGKDVPYPLLEAIADEGDRGMRAQLAHLQASEFLYEASLFPQLEYTFKHALTHEVAYGTLLQDRRRALHTRILEAMERLYAGRLADHVERLAHHAVRAEAWASAIEYLREASAKAAGRSAHLEAVRLIEEALEVQGRLDPEDSPKRCDLLLDLGEALGPAGEPERVFQEVAEEAFTLAEALGDADRASRACRVAVQAVRRHAIGSAIGMPVFLRWVERADGYAPPGTRARAIVDAEQAPILNRTGRWVDGRERAVRALQLARQLDDPEALFAAASFFALLSPWAAPQRWDERLALAHEVAERPREGVSTRTLDHALLAAHQILFAAGDRDRAEEILREREELAKRTQDATLGLSFLWRRATLACLDGDLEGALAAAAEMVDRARDLHMAPGANQGGYLTYWPLIYLGRAEEAAADGPEAWRLIGRTRRQSYFYIGEVALCLAHAGRLAEARELLAEDLRLLETSEQSDEAPARVLIRLLATAVLVGDRATAARLAPPLEHLVAWPSPLTNVARWLGGAAELLGDPAAARAHYARGLEWATQLRHRPEIALTRLALAELIVGGDALTPGLSQGEREQEREALAHLEFVIPEFRAMKMGPSLEQAERLRDRLTAS